MKRSITPGSLKGSIEAPGSKSIFQRAALMALFNQSSDVKIMNSSLCEDDLAAIALLIECGKHVFVLKNNVLIAPSKELKYPRQLNVKESGLLCRFMSAILLLDGKDHVISGEGTLFQRDLSFLNGSINAIECEIRSNGKIPFSVKGPLKAGTYFVDCRHTSQFMSGLIIALSQVEGQSIVYPKYLVSKKYLGLTVKMLKSIGVDIVDSDQEKIIINGKADINFSEYHVEGDWSSASNIIVAGLLNGDVSIRGLNKNSIQADKEILNLLDNLNINYEFEYEFKISKQEYNGFIVDLEDTPDLIPIVTVLALNAKNKSRIKGISRLEIKESNRKEVLISEFAKLGVKINVEDNEFVIEPQKVNSGAIDSHNDHRIAMAFSVAAINAAGEISIENSNCVSKSYPTFFYHLENLGAKVVE